MKPIFLEVSKIPQGTVVDERIIFFLVLRLKIWCLYEHLTKSQPNFYFIVHFKILGKGLSFVFVFFSNLKLNMSVLLCPKNK